MVLKERLLHEQKRNREYGDRKKFRPVREISADAKGRDKRQVRCVQFGYEDQLPRNVVGFVMAVKDGFDIPKTHGQ